MPTVTSRDGTTIAYEQSGAGPALILVDGAMCYRAFGPMRGLAALLAPHFTVFAYDRRGRGESGDTAPYAVEREVEDIEALIDAAGGTACIFGMSSGAVLAFDAARLLPDKITKLAGYEAPLIAGDNAPPLPEDYVEQQTKLLSEGRRGDMVELFMKLVGTPAGAIAGMRQSPVWPQFEAIAPTLIYDGTIMGDNSVPTAQLAAIRVPALVMAGGASPEWMRTTAYAIADAIPGAE